MRKLTNTDFFIKVSTGKNLYNLDTTKFNGYILNENTGEITNLTDPFSEVLLNITSVSSTLSSNVEGLKTIPVDDGSVFSDGDVIKIDNTFYYISSISGNNINLLVPCDLHTSGATVETVGNTGIYKVKANLAIAGDYTAFINNAAIDMQNTTCPLSIVDASNADIEEQISILSDEIIRSSFI